MFHHTKLDPAVCGLIAGLMLLITAPAFAFTQLNGNKIHYEGDRTPNTADSVGNSWTPNSGGNDCSSFSIAGGIGSVSWLGPGTYQGMRAFSIFASGAGTGAFAVGGTGGTIELNMRFVPGGSNVNQLDLQTREGNYDCHLTLTAAGIAVLNTSYNVAFDWTAFHQVRLAIKDGKITIWVDADLPKLNQANLPSSGGTGTGGIDIYASLPGTTQIQVDYIEVSNSAVNVPLNVPTTPTPGPFPTPLPPQNQTLFPPPINGGPHTEVSAGMHVTIGETRVLMQHTSFPTMTRYNDNSIICAAVTAEGGSEVYVRSTDLGQTWKAFSTNRYAQLQLANGTTVVVDLPPGTGSGPTYTVTHGESYDRGVNWTNGISGTLTIPTAAVPAAYVKQFHGNLIQLPNGDLMSPMQGGPSISNNNVRTWLVKSTNNGKDWTYVSDIASLATISDPDLRLSQGWKHFGPCEPCLVYLGGNNLACFSRLVNDDYQPLVGSPMTTYHDLSYTLLGSEIFPYAAGTGEIPTINDTQYAACGPQMEPLIMSTSSDLGATWAPATVMDPQRGMQPQALVSNGILALAYGGLAFPRWGNAITFSHDNGQTWTKEFNFAPYFTTGYVGYLVSTGPGKFLVAFDATNPQEWTEPEAHWTGLIEFTVTYP